MKTLKKLLPLVLTIFFLASCGTGPSGPQGPKGDKGDQGEVGPQGEKGVSIVKVEKTSSEGNVDTYTISFSDGNTSTFNITNGIDGHSPSISIGTNGNWFIDNIDTGKSAKGIQGDKGNDGTSILNVVKTSSSGLVDTYTIIYSNGDTSTFTLINGKDGLDGFSVLTGNGEPTSSFGKDGDSYIDLDNFNYYLRNDNCWILKGNIKGGKGDTGVSITNTTIDDNGDLIVTFSNGDVINAGHVKDVTTYTVNFYCDNDLVDTQIVEPNSKLVNVLANKKIGYKFDYWYADGYINKPWAFDGYYADKVTENVDLYAKYSPLVFTYSLDAGEEGTVYPNVIKFTYENHYQLPIPATTKKEEDKELTFDSWYIGEDKLPIKGDSWSYLNNEETIIANYIPVDDYFTFTKDETSNSYILSGCKVQRDEIVIPNTYKGLPVTTISGDAFDHCNKIKSIIIPDSITTICEHAFSDCSLLKSIYIPDSVETIEEFAFGGLETELMLIYCETNSKPEGWAKYWYGSCERIQWGVNDYGTYNGLNYAIKDDGVAITGGNDSSITSLYVPDEIYGFKVKVIGTKAFEQYTSLIDVRLPDSIVEIEYRAFARCNSIVSLNIPQNLEILDDSSLYNCSSLESVVFHNTLHTINMYALSGCSSLTTIMIPRSVKIIGQCILSRDTNIKTIYCESPSQPIGWDDEWNLYCDAEVIWGYIPD